jgi:hypothetical protein
MENMVIIKKIKQVRLKEALESADSSFALPTGTASGD